MAKFQTKFQKIVGDLIDISKNVEKVITELIEDQKPKISKKLKENADKFNEFTNSMFNKAKAKYAKSDCCTTDEVCCCTDSEPKKQSAKKMQPKKTPPKKVRKKVKKTTSKKATDTTMDVVLKIIKSYPNGIDAETIAEKTGYDKRKVHNIAYKLKLKNKLTSPKKGSYKVK